MAMDELWQANTFQQARAAACSGHRAAPSRRGQPPQGGRASQPGQLHRDLHFLQRAYLRREVHLLLHFFCLEVVVNLADMCFIPARHSLGDVLAFLLQVVIDLALRALPLALAVWAEDLNLIDLLFYFIVRL